jgi:hypothetical protein
MYEDDIFYLAFFLRFLWTVGRVRNQLFPKLSNVPQKGGEKYVFPHDSGDDMLSSRPGTRLQKYMT